MHRAGPWGRDGLSRPPEALGVDKVQWQRGHNYLTLVYQIDAGARRLLWVGLDRTEESLRGFFRLLDDAAKSSIRYLCSDMWKPYLNVLAQEISGAIHVLDRFHIMQPMNKAIDEVRAEEARRLTREGYEPILKHARWCLLKRPENLTKKQTVKLAELVKYNLKSVRSYLLRDDFQRFWTYRYAGWAGQFLREWCVRTMRSRIEPMKKVARMLRGHEALILNWFKARGTISAGVAEGPEQQGETDHQKGLRLPDVRRGANRPVSQPWGPTRAGVHPQILLRRQRTRRLTRRRGAA